MDRRRGHLPHLLGASFVKKPILVMSFDRIVHYQGESQRHTTLTLCGEYLVFLVSKPGQTPTCLACIEALDAQTGRP